MRTLTGWVAVLVPVLLGLAANEAPDPAPEKVLAFARSQFGEIVGDGHCSALASEALRNADAARPDGSGGWGEPLDSLQDVRPGDILVFKEARFTGREVRPDGRGVAVNLYFADHVAIVSAVARQRRPVLLRVIHQNVRTRGRDENGVVQEWTLNMARFRGGSLRAYRPVSAAITQNEQAPPEPAPPTVPDQPDGPSR